MNKEEKEAIKYLDMMENKINFDLLGYVYGNETIDTILNLIQKQSKIIDKMADQLAGLVIWKDEEDVILGDKEEVKEYFKKVVDEDVKD